MSQKASVHCVHCRSTVEIFFRVSFNGDLLQFINGLLLAYFNVRSNLIKSCVQRIRCPVKVTSFQSSEPTWKSFRSLVKTRCSISFPPVPKRLRTKRLMIPATDFPVVELPSMGSSVFFSNAVSIFDRWRISLWTYFGNWCCAMAFCSQFFLSSLTRLYWVQHMTASISSRRNRTITAQRLVKDIPPASRGIIYALCKFLQSGSNVWWMTCFSWWLTRNITVHIIRLSLKKSCLEINMKKIPSTGCHLTTHSKSGSSRSRWISL